MQLLTEPCETDLKITISLSPTPCFFITVPNKKTKYFILYQIWATVAAATHKSLFDHSRTDGILSRDGARLFVLSFQCERKKQPVCIDFHETSQLKPLIKRICVLNDWVTVEIRLAGWKGDRCPVRPKEKACKKTKNGGRQGKGWQICLRPVMN